MSKPELVFVLVLTSVGFVAGSTGDAAISEKIFLIISPLLMWFVWRRVIRQLRRR